MAAEFNQCRQNRHVEVVLLRAGPPQEAIGPDPIGSAPTGLV